MTYLLLLLLAAYLVGSVSFAVVVSRLMSLPDPHSYGSGNPGATNVLRTGNRKAAVLTLLGDALKGWIVVVLASYLGPRFGFGPGDVAAAGLAAFLGHLYPVYFGFRGGKGVATAAGVLLGLSLWLGLAVLFVWVAAFAVTRISSVGAITAASAAPLVAWALHANVHVTMVILAMAVLLVWRHRSNIRKLRAGVESAVGRK
ncbi:MAG: glycerol-3-phosphate 1-O-acyltransferase PlsY [Betaproteobacteria bacterium]|nr:glycerol-3-phosphate 1-O-acyltransferase PlsY [Betaproteobacteria bacterium]